MRVVVWGLCFGTALLFAASANADAKVWELLRGGGQVVLIRHAETTPGIGDPKHFRAEDCATQRNLSKKGREQARRMGAELRDRDIPIGEVLTSRWCRTVDTAQLAFGRHVVWPALNSLFHDRSREKEQTEAVRRRIAAFRGPGNMFLIGHGANILALTGIHPSQGGMVVLTPDGKNGFRIAGELELEIAARGPTDTVAPRPTIGD
jgi:phosphohistidine phosphatase SixA